MTIHLKINVLLYYSADPQGTQPQVTQNHTIIAVSEKIYLKNNIRSHTRIPVMRVLAI